MNGTEATDFGTDGTEPRVGSGRMGGFGYGVGVSVGVLLLITAITLASYFCTRANTSQPQLPARRRGRPHGAGGETAVVDVEAVGLDEATLTSYPTLLYSEAKARGEKGTSTSSCCSICLADYKDSEVLRLLPDCGHLFHLGCVDPWLRRQPTCPVCRTSPMPSPLPTPLAEVAPLARQL